VTANSILKNYESYSQNLNEKRHPDVNSLVYVTPWNNHGYDVAKIWGSKFTYVSPVWFSLKPGKNPKNPAKLNMVIEGGMYVCLCLFCLCLCFVYFLTIKHKKKKKSIEHDVDKGWLNDVWYGQFSSNDEQAKREKRTKIVPRIRLDGLTPQLYMTFVKESSLLEIIIKNVDALCQ